MISGTGRSRRKAGFTLLELITTLAVIGLFTGLLVFNFAGEDREEELTRVSVALQKAALLAKYEAHVSGRDHFLTLGETGFTVTDTDLSVGEETGSRYIGGQSVAEVLSSGEFPQRMTCRFRKHETEPWKTPRGESWVFRSSGLNDPMEIRIAIDEDFAFLQFNVLTGRAESFIVIE